MAAPMIMSDSSTPQSYFAVIVDLKFAQIIRQKLEKDDLWDDRRCLQRLGDDKVAIPITNEGKDVLSKKNRMLDSQDVEFDLRVLTLPPSKKALIVTPHKKLVNVVRKYLLMSDIAWNTAIGNDIPKHWERHNDLVVFPETKFSRALWMEFGTDFWIDVAGALGARRVAKKSSVNDDVWRTPSVRLILGDDGWVEHVDNGIRYTFDVTKCMFSMGNITEKLRLSELNCQDEIVVDLYAGIGYFTLPYLVHAKASMVHACEWNPNSVEALKKNLLLNGVNNRCVVYAGDNRKLCPRGVADRVNLGLIPSSEAGWPVACAALKPLSGGVLHIHGNVTTAPVRLTVGHPPGDGQSPPDPSTEGPFLAHGKPAPDHPEPCGVTEHGINCSTVCSHGNKELSDCTNPQSLVIESSDKANCDRLDRTVDHECYLEADHSANRLTGKARSGSDKAQWYQWASTVSSQIQTILQDEWRTEWTVNVLHLEHVKSYAPHVDHLVVDLQCTPNVQ